MNKDIWHKADITPEPCRILICKTNKGQNYTAIIPSPQEWNTMILPEFYSLGDIENAERIEQYAYLDDLLDCEQELIRTKELLEIEDAEHKMCHTQMLKTTEKLKCTRKALDVAVDALKEIKDGKTPVSLGICMDINDALDKITAEQKDE